MRWHLHHHDVVDSTSERSFAAIAEGSARHGDVHVARAQTAGRGRLGRRWESAPGEGLYLSVVLLPPAPGPPPPALTLAGGLATLEGAERLGLAGARLDWPNDVMAGAAKLAGVLVESRGLDPERPAYVLGIGLNVRQRGFPPELTGERPVTSLALLGVEATPAEALDAVLSALGPRLEQALAADAALAAAFLARTELAGAGVEVELARRRVRGSLLGLDLERGLVLRAEGGKGGEDGELELPLAHVRALRRLGHRPALDSAGRQEGPADLP